MARDAAFRCVYCLVGQGGQEMAHVVSEDDGGPTHPGDLVVCCEWCNSRKGVMHLDLFTIYLTRRGKGGKGGAAAIVARVQYQLSLPAIDPNETE